MAELQPTLLDPVPVRTPDRVYDLRLTVTRSVQTEVPDKMVLRIVLGDEDGPFGDAVVREIPTHAPQFTNRVKSLLLDITKVIEQELGA